MFRTTSDLLCVAEGVRKSPCVAKTKISCIPPPSTVSNFLKDSQESNVNQIRRKYLRGKNKQKQTESNRNNSNNSSNININDNNNNNGNNNNNNKMDVDRNDGQKKKKQVVVGAEAKAIEEDNIGKALLRKMGWFGGGLGIFSHWNQSNQKKNQLQ
jgi:ABC-type antimicrobial peptide transport system permease subunit